MLTRITGGEIIDPVNGRSARATSGSGTRRSSSAPRRRQRRPDLRRFRLHRHGRRDRHPLPYRRRQCEHGAAAPAGSSTPRIRPRPAATPLSNAGWSTFETGCLYAKMGFTTVVEPAMSPGAALHTHLELADIPIIDKATLAILGNDDFLLSMIRDDASPRMIEDYVAWTVGLDARARRQGHQCRRRGRLQGECPHLLARRRRAVLRRQFAQDRQDAAGGGGPARHPASAACPLQQSRRSPGSADTAAATIAAAEGVPLHLAHLQFYGYGTEGKRKFSSAAARLAELVNATPEVTIDVGQVMFGQTVTVSSDVMRQFSARGTRASEEDASSMTATAMAAASCPTATARIITARCNGPSGSSFSC